MLSLYSWNVNGVRAAHRKGFLDWLTAVSPDILCLQETKCHPDQLDAELRQPDGYHTYWAWAEKKGYSGVALYSKTEPLSVQIGLGIEEFDREGRTIIAEYDDFVLMGAYFPNGGRKHLRVPYKMAFKQAFIDHSNALIANGKRVLFCGDVNTSHRPIDLARPKQNKNSTGFLPQERAWIDEILAQGYVDTFRHFHPDAEGAYSWWSYMRGQRARNVGWRLDYFFASANAIPFITNAAIHPEVTGSDHCPVSVDFKYLLR